MSLQTQRLRRNPFKTTEQLKLRTWVIVTAITVATLVVFHFWTFRTFPLTHVDEGWFANRAAGYLSSGVPFGTMDSGVFDRYPEPWVIFPLLPTMLQALVFDLVGGVDLAALRVLSLIAGGVLLYVVFRIGCNVAGRWAGTAAVAIVGASLPFAFSSHLARHDILAAAAGWSAVSIFFLARSRWMDVAAGLMVMVGVEMHPNAAIFGVVLVVLALLDDADRTKRAMAITAGGLIGLVGFASIHILPNPESYSAVNTLAFAESHVPPVLSGSLDAIVQSFTGKVLVLESLYPFVGGMGWLLAVAVFGSLAALYTSRVEKERRLALMAILVLVSFGILVRNTQLYYMILIAPAISLVLSVGAVRLVKLRQRMAWRRGALTIVAAMLIGLAWPAFGFVLSFRNEFDRVSRDVVSTLEPSETVMGAQNYWFAAPNTDWRSWESLVYHRRMEPGSTVREAFVELDPDVLVVDSQLRSFVVEDRTRGGFVGALSLPADEFHDVLARGTLVATIDDGSVEGVQVYRFP